MATVTWDRLATAHGTATRVPQALSDLQSQDADVRRSARFQIDNVVVLQSDLYEAAPFTALALLEILAANPEYGRDHVYDLLYEIGNGYSDDSQRVELPDGTSGTLMALCRQIMESGLELYERDVLSNEPQVRKQALDVIGSFENRRAEAMKVLQDALARADEAVRPEVVSAIETLAGD